jgi:hypothetical protein
MNGEEHERQQHVFDGVLVERHGYVRGWVATLPSGSNATFRTEKDAWAWLDRQTSRRHGR